MSHHIFSTGVYALGKAETARQTGSLSGADMDRLAENPPDLQVLTFNRLGLQGGAAIRASDKTLPGAVGVSGMLRPRTSFAAKLQSGKSSVPRRNRSAAIPAKRQFALAGTCARKKPAE